MKINQYYLQTETVISSCAYHEHLLRVLVFKLLQTFYRAAFYKNIPQANNTLLPCLMSLRSVLPRNWSIP